MKFYRGKRLQKGTSLVEVVTAIAIIAIASGGLMGAFSYGFFTSQIVRENQRATQIIVENLETLRLYSFDQVTSNNFIPSTFSAVFDPQGATNVQGCKYYGSLKITNFPFATSYGSNMRQVTLSVSWTNQGKLGHTRSLTTYIAKDGVQNYVY